MVKRFCAECQKATPTIALKDTSGTIVVLICLEHEDPLHLDNPTRNEVFNYA